MDSKIGVELRIWGLDVGRRGNLLSREGISSERAPHTANQKFASRSQPPAVLKRALDGSAGGEMRKADKGDILGSDSADVIK